MSKIKKFVIECTEEQLDDLKSVIDYVLNFSFIVDSEEEFIEIHGDY